MTPPVSWMWQLGPWVGLLGSHGQDMTEEPSCMWPGILPSPDLPCTPCKGFFHLQGLETRLGHFLPHPSRAPRLRVQNSGLRHR